MSSQGRESPDLDPAGRVVPADASNASCSTNASNTRKYAAVACSVLYLWVWCCVSD